MYYIKILDKFKTGSPWPTFQDHRTIHRISLWTGFLQKYLIWAPYFKSGCVLYQYLRQGGKEVTLTYFSRSQSYWLFLWTGFLKKYLTSFPQCGSIIWRPRTGFETGSVWPHFQIHGAIYRISLWMGFLKKYLTYEFHLKNLSVLYQDLSEGGNWVTLTYFSISQSYW